MSSTPSDDNNNPLTAELSQITLDPTTTDKFSSAAATVAPRQRAIQTILQSTPHEPEQIDALAAHYGWFRGDPAGTAYTTVQAYMSGSLDRETAVRQLTARVDEAYSTGDYRIASTGDDNSNVNHDDGGDDNNSTESLLWDLWYSILHTAKRTPWTDSQAQNKLINLVRALKAHPNPAFPSLFPPEQADALRNNWIWSSGTLWSELILLGLATRECWNDMPWCDGNDSEITIPEIHAWTNVNAFVARLDKEGVVPMCVFGRWAMEGALGIGMQQEKGRRWTPSTTELNAYVPAAAVWILIVGEELWERERERERENQDHEAAYERWCLWKDRLDRVSLREDVLSETREMAEKASRRMEEIIPVRMDKRMNEWNSERRDCAS